MKSFILCLVATIGLTVLSSKSWTQKVYDFEDYQIMLVDDVSPTVAGDLRGKDIQIQKENRGLRLHNQHKERVRIKILEGKNVLQDEWVLKGSSYRLDCSKLDYGHYNIVIIAESGGIIKKLEVKKEKT